MKRLVLAALGVVALGAMPAQAECKIGTIYFNLHEATTTELQLNSGEYCAGQFRIPKLNITQAVVFRQPKNGLVNFDQKTYTWKYRPFAQFKGEDQFVLRIHGYTDKRNGDGTIVFRSRVQ